MIFGIVMVEAVLPTIDPKPNLILLCRHRGESQWCRSQSARIFDRTAGGYRFDFTRGVCVLCRISREEFKDNDYPECAGEPYGKRERLAISRADRVSFAPCPAARAGAVPAAVMPRS